MYLTLRGRAIPNHGYVMISDIGNTIYEALLCHTRSQSYDFYDYYYYYPYYRYDYYYYYDDPLDGNWFSPTNDIAIEGFYTKTSPLVLWLYRNSSISADQSANGIYHCTARDITSEYQTAYVGVYNSGNGELVLENKFLSINFLCHYNTIIIIILFQGLLNSL